MFVSPGQAASVYESPPPEKLQYEKVAVPDDAPSFSKKFRRYHVQSAAAYHLGMTFRLLQVARRPSDWNLERLIKSVLAVMEFRLLAKWS